MISGGGKDESWFANHRQRSCYKFDLTDFQHSALGTQSLKPYKTFQADESRILMQDLLRDPENFAHHFERYAGSLVSILGWGRRIDTMEDHILKTALDVSCASSADELWKCGAQILVGAGL